MSELAAIETLDEYVDFFQAAAEKSNHRSLHSFRGWYMEDFDPPGKTLLDMGGYTGATAKHYAAQGHQVTSIELADEYCEEFLSNCRGLANIRLVHGLIEDFDEPDSYDACCCTELLHQVFDPEKVVRVGYRSLKPGGLMFVTVPAWVTRTERCRPTMDQMSKWLEMAGFRDVVSYLKPCVERWPQYITMGWK